VKLQLPQAEFALNAGNRILIWWANGPNTTKRFVNLTIFEEATAMTQQDLLAIIEEGVENGRIPAHLAAYIVAEVTGVEASATGYDERVRLDDAADKR